MKDSLLYGLHPSELAIKTEALIRTALIQKAAAYVTADKTEKIEISRQWIWSETHQFLKEIIGTQEKKLIYEWCMILKSKNAILPLNLLVELLEWSLSDFELAQWVLPVSGHSATDLANAFPKWNVFSPALWSRSIQFGKKDLRLFAFTQFRNHDSENAFAYFIQNHDQIKESEKPEWIGILKRALTAHELHILIETLKESKYAIQKELILLSLIDFNSDYYRICKIDFQKSLTTNSLNRFSFKSFGKKIINWNPSQMASCIPVSFIENEKQASLYLQWVEENNCEQQLLESFKISPSQTFLNLYFKELLDKNRLKENFQMERLSSGFDHNGFNNACLMWIDKTGDSIDLEAFLHFINLEKHFWTDELMIKIIELRNYKVLQRKYDFNIFWELMPFKINPNSAHLNSIPPECKIFFSKLVHFDSIIQFRKWIRK